MKVIRRGVWETNSSMTHSCVIMTTEKDKQWESGDLYLYRKERWWNPFKDLPTDEQPVHDQLYTKDEVLAYLHKIGCDYDENEYEDIDEFLREFDVFISYADWGSDDYLEYDSEEYTTPGGEEIVVHCKYGRDG